MVLIRILFVVFFITCAFGVFPQFEIKKNGNALKETRKALRTLRDDPANSVSEFFICGTISCVNGGQTCGQTSPINSAICLGDYFCDADVSNTGLCIAMYPVNHTCTVVDGNDEQCLGNNCVNNTFYGPTYTGICGPSGYQEAGDSCSIDADCSLSMPCKNGVCFGGDLGASCTVSAECNPPYWCNATVCTNTLPLGATCQNDDDQCGITAYCASLTQGAPSVCTGLFTATVGSPCTEDTLCPDGSICTNYDSANLGTCVVVGSSSLKSCTNSSQCNQYEECNCNLSQGKGQCISPQAYPSGFSAAYQAAVNCAAQKCNNVFDTNGCMAANCHDSYCKYWNFALEGTQQYYLNIGYPQCYVNSIISSAESYYPECTWTFQGSSDASITVVSFVGLLVVGLLTILVI